MKDSIFNWSGGKDSALCLYHCLKDNSINIKYLLTTLNKDHNRISMHGVRRELLWAQAERIGIPLKEVLLPEAASLSTYNELMKATLTKFKNEAIDYSIFGDIFLEDLKIYREEKLSEVNMKGLFPIWRRSSKELLNEFLDLGFKTIIVCVNEKYLDKSYTGRIIDKDFMTGLPEKVDPCGENGEFHSFVFDGPIFNRPIKFEKGEVVYRQYKPSEDDDCFKDETSQNYDTGFWYIDLALKD